MDIQQQRSGRIHSDWPKPENRAGSLPNKKRMTKVGEMTLNEFEKTILERFTNQVPALAPFTSQLEAIRRELTGVGSFTHFARRHTVGFDTSTGPIPLDIHILIPGIQHGLGALLFFSANTIDCLEIFAYGDDAWGGNWEGFSFAGGERSS